MMAICYRMAYDNLDSKLINELIGNGRASLRGLGEGLDVSVTTVSNHIEQLESDSVIQGYTPIVDYGKLGYDVTAITHLKVEGSALTEIVDRLRTKNQMISVYEITGNYDIIAIGKFKNTNGMNAQIKELLSDVDIRESNTSVVLNSVKEYEQFDLDVDEE